MAWQSGRVDEAGALLAAPPLCDFLPAKELARDVAVKLLQRAGDRFARGDSAAGWQDLSAADRLGGSADSSGELRRQYAERMTCEALCNLAAGDAAAAAANLAKLDRRGISGETLRILRQITVAMQSADQS
ncbi:MAG TPA: hypothetical protein VH835_18160, partial [Dongiaceae bacterium]